MEQKFSAKAVVNDTLVVWKSRYQYLYTLLLGVLVISLIPIIFLTPGPNSYGPFFVLNIVLEVLYLYVLMATTALILRLLRANEEHPVKDLLNYWPIFFKYLVVSILYGLMVLGGVILLILPGIYLAIRYAWVTLYFIEHPEKSIKELFHEAAAMTAGRRWEILWLLIILVVPIMLVSSIVDGVVAQQVPRYQQFVVEVVNYALIIPWALLLSCNAYLKLSGTRRSPAASETVPEPQPQAPREKVIAMPEAEEEEVAKPVPELVP